MTGVVSRRQLLTGIISGGMAASFGGCSSAGGSKTTSRSLSALTTLAQGNDDIRTSNYLAGLEAFALSAYSQLNELVNNSKVPSPSAAMASLINTAAAHHSAHLDAWNSVLATVGHPTVTKPDRGLVVALAPIVQKAISIGVGDATVSLEQLLASNYVTAGPTFGSAGRIRLAASVELVEWQHVAAALFLLNKSPVPEAFASDALSQ